MTADTSDQPESNFVSGSMERITSKWPKNAEYIYLEITITAILPLNPTFLGTFFTEH